MTKKIITTILIIHSVFATEVSSLQASPILSLDRITHNQKNITVSLKNRPYYRSAFTAIKVGMGTLATIQAAANAFNTTAWLFGYAQPITVGYEAYAPESRKEWAIKSMLSVLGTLGFYCLFAKAEQNYGSAADIRWFVATQQPFYSTLRDLYFLAQESSRSTQSEYLMLEIKRQFTRLINQTEQVIAFMRYKKESLSENKKLDAQHAIDHLLERIEPLYQDITHAIEIEAHNVAYHLDAALMILEGSCARFAQAEGTQWINPSAVLNMMQNMTA